ncbi:MAG: ABC transporter permease [Castellaniella sp.]
MMTRTNPPADNVYSPENRQDVGATKTKIKRKASNRKFINVLISITAVLFAVLMWWVAAKWIVDSEIILPTPGQVIDKFMILAVTTSGEQSLWLNLSISVMRVLAGWGLGLVVGVTIGIAMANSRYILFALDPLLEAGRAIPPLAFAPLVLVWFGIGETSKIVLLFFAAFPIFAISTTAAILRVDVSLKRTALTLGASRSFMLRAVTIPSVLPEIFVAMRVASAIVWTTLVAAELLAASQGLGFMIMKAGRFLDTATIFVGIIMIGIAAYIIDRIIRIIEHKLVPWKGKG